MTKEQIIAKFSNPTFNFDEKEHKYTLNGKELVSATTFIKRFHKEFDMLYWAKQKGRDSGLGTEYMLQLWEDKKIKSQILGTNVHKYIEDFFNKDFSKSLDAYAPKEINKITVFNEFYNNHLCRMNPFLFEFRIYDEEWLLSGTIDSIFEHNGKLYILDWKTNEEFKLKTYNRLFKPFHNLYENDLSKYSIQMSIYSEILSRAGIEIEDSFIVHIGSNELTLHKALKLNEEIKSYFK